MKRRAHHSKVISSIESDTLKKCVRKHLQNFISVKFVWASSSSSDQYQKKLKTAVINDTSFHSDCMFVSVNPIAQYFMVAVITNYSQSNSTKTTSKALQGVSAFLSAILACTLVKYGQL